MYTIVFENVDLKLKSVLSVLGKELGIKVVISKSKNKVRKVTSEDIARRIENFDRKNSKLIKLNSADLLKTKVK